MSRQELAEAVNAYLWNVYQEQTNLDWTDIGKLERGEHRWPGQRRREAFRAVLHARTDAALGFHIRRRQRSDGQRKVDLAEVASGDAVMVRVVVDGHERRIPLSRRALFEAVTGTLIAPLLDGPEIPAPRAIDPAIVNHFADLRALLVDSDNRLGAATVLPTAHHQLSLIAHYRRGAGGSLHEQLLRTQAWWAEFASWLSDDLGDHASGAWWLSQAITMAQQANDQDFAAYLFARMAQRAAAGPDQDRVLSLAEAAGRVGTARPHVQAFVALQRAHAHAVAGEQGRFAAAIDEARTLIEGRIAPPGDLGSFCSVPYVTAHAADGWLRLNRANTAAELFNEALAGWPDPYRRERGLYLSRSALAHLACDQPDEAAVMGQEALTVADVTHSARTRQEVAALGQRLTPLRHRPAVANLLDALALPGATAGRG